MNKTKIEWATRSWNPVVGCSEISEACRNCYAKYFSWRIARIAEARHDEPYAGKYRELVTRTGTRWTGKIAWFPERLKEPYGRDKRNERIFLGSMTDLFHPNVGTWMLDKIFDVIRETPNSTYLILTKRPTLTRKYWTRLGKEWRPDNVWLGVTAENQKRADERIPELLAIPGVAVRFVSAEPLLEAIDFRQYMNGNSIDWIIVGAETGRGAREFRIEWGYQVLAQARNEGIPFFFKNLRGRAVPPENLYVREFPR